MGKSHCAAFLMCADIGIMAEVFDNTSDRFVVVDNNPVPDGARLMWFTGVGGRRLRACFVPANVASPRGTCIIGPGRTEFIEKYFEVARDLTQRGFSVLIIDWPGQGLSERLLDDSMKGHIDRFETFIGALQNGLAAAGDDLPKPYIALAHSMGGAITLAALAQKMVDVKAAAFCAPMWGFRTRFFGMRYFVWAMRMLGRGGHYAVAPGPKESFEHNVVTNCEARWNIQQALVEAAPELDLGPVTWGWLGASLSIISTFARKELIGAMDFPVFLASAEDERLVDNDSHTQMAASLPDCEHITVAGAKHEILMETDERRAEFWAGFDRMLDRAKI